MELNTDTCYQALLAHDSRFDGVFFVGVASTGIYCRPVCTAKMPRRENCTFHRSASAAERAGFRPCLRCRPELAPGNAQIDATNRLAAAAAGRIEDGALIDGGVEDLAAELGVSGRHLRRVVEQEFGVTPVELAQTFRLLLAKRLLTDTDMPVIEVAFASGFTSLRRFNALFKERYRLNPTGLRKVRKGAGEAAALTCEIAYCPPLDWPAMMDFLCGRVCKGVEAVQGDRYLRTIAIERKSNSSFVRGKEEEGSHTKAQRHEEEQEKNDHSNHVVNDSRSRYIAFCPGGALGRRPPSVALHGIATGDHELPLNGNLVEPLAAQGIATGWLAVSPVAGRDTLRVEVSLSLAPVLREALATVKRVFDLAARPEQISAHLGAIAEARPGLRVPGAFHGFEMAVRAILGQQVSVAAATTLAGRFVQAFGEPIVTPFEGLTHLSPDPCRIARADPAELVALGILNSRAKSILALAQALTEGSLTLRPGRDVERTIARLKELPGIGEWTAQYIAMRALGWPDAFPHTDLGIRKALNDPGPKRVLEIAEAWRPWRAYATMHLWKSLEKPQ